MLFHSISVVDNNMGGNSEKCCLIKNALDFLEKCPEDFSASIDWLHERCAPFRRLKRSRVYEAEVAYQL